MSSAPQSCSCVISFWSAQSTHLHLQPSPFPSLKPAVLRILAQKPGLLHPRCSLHSGFSFVSNLTGRPRWQHGSSWPTCMPSLPGGSSKGSWRVASSKSIWRMSVTAAVSLSGSRRALISDTRQEKRNAFLVPSSQCDKQ